MAMLSRPIHRLPVGSYFEVRDLEYGPTYGQLLRVPPSLGYAQVKVWINPKTYAIVAGAMGHKAARWNTLEWSASTLVYPTKWRPEMGKADSDEDTGDVSSIKFRKRIEGVLEDEPLSDKKETPLMAKIAKLQAGAKAKKEAAKLKQTPRKIAPKSTPKPQNPCKCGCGELVKNNFRQGHDGRYHGWLKKVADGKLKFAELNETVRRELKNEANVKAAVREHEKVKAKNKADRV